MSFRDLDNLIKLLNRHGQDYDLRRYGKFITIDISTWSYDFHITGMLIGKYTRKTK